MPPNIKYELLELEQLTSGDHPLTKENREKALKEKVEVEVKRIKQTLMYEVFHFEDERHLERYIQYHQQSLIRLLDKVDATFQREDPARHFFKLLYSALDELLTFIERHFTKYFDQDAKAPTGYVALVGKETKADIKKLEKLLDAKIADPRLTTLLLQVLKKIVDRNADVGTTYRKILYAKEIKKELFRIATEPGTDINDALREAMYYLNYNSIKVITYHAHYISELLDTAETRTEKIEKLSLILKNINQAQVKPGIGYNLHATQLKNQLSDYISIEIEYQERLQQLNSTSPDPPSDNFLSGFKLKFEASVAQLAYLLKILTETKVILNNNLTQVIHFLVRFVITKRAENVSYGSFRAKFYNVEFGTKASVRNMLTSLIAHIDKN